MVMKGWVWPWWAGGMVGVVLSYGAADVVLIDVLFCQLCVLVTNT